MSSKSKRTEEEKKERGRVTARKRRMSMKVHSIPKINLCWGADSSDGGQIVPHRAASQNDLLSTFVDIAQSGTVAVRVIETALEGYKHFVTCAIRQALKIGPDNVSNMLVRSAKDTAIQRMIGNAFMAALDYYDVKSAIVMINGIIARIPSETELHGLSEKDLTRNQVAVEREYKPRPSMCTFSKQFLHSIYIFCKSKHRILAIIQCSVEVHMYTALNIV